jgi:hypothetical protein
MLVKSFNAVGELRRYHNAPSSLLRSRFDSLLRGNVLNIVQNIVLYLKVIS